MLRLKVKYDNFIPLKREVCLLCIFTWYIYNTHYQIVAVKEPKNDISLDIELSFCRQN